MKNCFWFGCLLFVLLSCETETIEVDGVVSGREYYPIDEGREWVYVTDSIIYDESRGRIDTFSGFIKEVITDLNVDGKYIIERSFTRNLMDPWRVTDIWSGRIEETNVVKTEENLSFIKLVFPPNIFSVWDGNSLFDENIEIVVAGEPLQPYQGWKYEIIDIEGTYSQNDISAVDVVEVMHVDALSIVDRRYSIERFAENIGMVEKKVMILDCQCSNVPESVHWEEKAEKGFILSQRLISYK